MEGAQTGASPTPILDRREPLPPAVGSRSWLARHRRGDRSDVRGRPGPRSTGVPPSGPPRLVDRGPVRAVSLALRPHLALGGRPRLVPPAVRDDPRCALRGVPPGQIPLALAWVRRCAS